MVKRKEDDLPGMSIREWCDLNNMSYNEFSQKVPCSQPYIGMIDNGKANPSYIMACRIQQLTNGLVPKTRWYPDDIKPIGADDEDYNVDPLGDIIK